MVDLKLFIKFIHCIFSYIINVIRGDWEKMSFVGNGNIFDPEDGTPLFPQKAHRKPDYITAVETNFGIKLTLFIFIIVIILIIALGVLYATSSRETQAQSVSPKLDNQPINIQSINEHPAMNPNKDNFRLFYDKEVTDDGIIADTTNIYDAADFNTAYSEFYNKNKLPDEDGFIHATPNWEYEVSDTEVDDIEKK